MDVGCFGPLRAIIYNQECLTFSRLHHKIVTRYDVCSLDCKAYTAALSPTNLRSAFAKARIFPYKTPTQVIESLGNKISPSKLYSYTDMTEKVDNGNNDNGNNDNGNKDNENNNNENNGNENMDNNKENDMVQSEKRDETETCDLFFVQHGGAVAKKVEKKKRRNISSVVGGKAVTEDETVSRMKTYMEESAEAKKKRLVNKTQTKESTKAQKKSPHKTPRKSQNKAPKKSPKSKGHAKKKVPPHIPSIFHSLAFLIFNLCCLRMASQVMTSLSLKSQIEANVTNAKSSM